MRLWHYELLKYLPRQQLLSQWKELNSIYAKKDKHILINFIYEYDLDDLFVYSIKVLNEMQSRGYKIKADRYKEYFKIYKYHHLQEIPKKLFKEHMNEEYLKICCWNLYEKYIRGQEGFTDEAIKFIKKQIGVK